MRRVVLLLMLVIAFVPCVSAQQFIVGADVSFLADAEGKGVVFHDHGQPADALMILRAHQYNWARLRIFVDPSQSDDKLPNDLPYTLALARRAQAAGMSILLDLHYSDTWADPGKQTMPSAWNKMRHKQLCEQVYSYTRDTIAAFAAAGVMPQMVQVGNEVTNGMLWPDGKLPDNWDNFADLLKAGIAGVTAGRGQAPRPAIMIHIERSGELEAATWFYDNLIAHHVPFDVIGLSYYPFWHGSTVKLRGNLHDLALRYQRPIIVVETAANWTPGSMDGKKPEFAETPEGQRAFYSAVVAAVKAVPKGLGRGVFWWEPAVAPSPIAGRGLFDEQYNALPALSIFDAPRK